MRIPGLSKLKAEGSTEPITDETAPITDEQQYEGDKAENLVEQEQNKVAARRALGRISAGIRKHGYHPSIEALFGRDLKAVGVDTSTGDKDIIADQIETIPGVEPISEPIDPNPTSATPATELLIVEFLALYAAAHVGVFLLGYAALWSANKLMSRLKPFEADTKVFFYSEKDFSEEMTRLEKQFELIESVLDSDMEKFNGSAFLASVKGLGFEIDESGEIETTSIEKVDSSFGELGWSEASVKAIRAKFDKFASTIADISAGAKEVASDLEDLADENSAASGSSKEQRRAEKKVIAVFREISRYSMSRALHLKKEFGAKFYK